jgi:hypothetical protein
MMTTSTFCLFVHGGSAWYVFTLDVLWALTMVFINRCGRVDGGLTIEKTQGLYHETWGFPDDL